MSEKRKVLWVSDAPAPENVRQAATGDWRLVQARPDVPLDRQMETSAVALVLPNGELADPLRFEALLDRLDASDTTSIVLIPPTATAAWDAATHRRGKFLIDRFDAPADELAGKLAAAWRLGPVITALRDQLADVRTGACDYGPEPDEIEEEIRLAAKLQQDFLPKRMPEVGPLRFGALFRPLSWVSGDLYDVVRLDETHVGFSVIDAVGHGIPAALLTMFVKRALPTKRIVGHSYQIIPPEAALADLNADLCEQDLSSCQFCTAVYCVVDAKRLTMTYCRAGHPEPIVFRADGGVEVLDGSGCLLGAFPDAAYESRRVRLQGGDRVVLYSDGLEEALCGAGNPDAPPLIEVLSPWASLPRDQLLVCLAEALDGKAASDGLGDDVTALVMDVDK